MPGIFSLGIDRMFRTFFPENYRPSPMREDIHCRCSEKGEVLFCNLFKGKRRTFKLEPDLESSLFSPVTPLFPPVKVQEQELLRKDGEFPDNVVNDGALYRTREKPLPAVEAAEV